MRDFDRMVHARGGGLEIVRYDRAGKWYIEPTDPTLSRQHVKLREAVQQAVWLKDERGGHINFGCAGGQAFDAAVRSWIAVRKARASR